MNKNAQEIFYRGYFRLDCLSIFNVAKYFSMVLLYKESENDIRFFFDK